MEPSIKLQGANDGFTLLECILAVGVLALALSSIVALQSSIISSTRMAVNKMQASWAIRSAMEQVQYILDVQGQTFIPEKISFPWEGDNSFITTVSRKDLKEIKPSQFLLSALKVSNATNPSANQNLDLDRTMAPIASMMDNSLETPQSKAPNNTSAPTSAQSYFCNVLVTATWGEGTQKHTLSDGLFLIDDNVLSHFKPPSQKSGASTPSGNPQTEPGK